MGTVNHERADAKLKELLEVAPAMPENFIGALDRVCPGWRISQTAGNRYAGSDHHWIVVMSRALHDTLPAPFNALGYDLDQSHGFNAVQAFGSKQSPDELRVWINNAIAHNDMVFRSA